MEIPLIVCRNSHHSTFAVTHQHIVADPNRYGFAGQRVSNFQACVHTLFFHRRHVGFGRAAVFAFFDELSELWIVL